VLAGALDRLDRDADAAEHQPRLEALGDDRADRRARGGASYGGATPPGLRDPNMFRSPF
jgi:hypothetical protein